LWKFKLFIQLLITLALAFGPGPSFYMIGNFLPKGNTQRSLNLHNSICCSPIADSGAIFGMQVMIVGIPCLTPRLALEGSCQKWHDACHGSYWYPLILLGENYKKAIGGD
jgi:hypothetical protein